MKIFGGFMQDFFNITILVLGIVIEFVIKQYNISFFTAF